MAEQTKTIHIDGMTCQGCVTSIYNATADIDGLTNMSIDLPGNQASVTFDDAVTSADKIASAIEDAGFEATVGGD